MSKVRMYEVNSKESHHNNKRMSIVVYFIIMIILVIVFFIVHSKWTDFQTAYNVSFSNQKFEYETPLETGTPTILFIGVDYEDVGHLNNRGPMTIALINIVEGNIKAEIIDLTSIEVGEWHTKPLPKEINQLGKSVKNISDKSIQYTMIVDLDNIPEVLNVEGTMPFKFQNDYQVNQVYLKANEEVQLNSRQLNHLMYLNDKETSTTYNQRQIEIMKQMFYNHSIEIKNNNFSKYSTELFNKIETNIPENNWAKKIFYDLIKSPQDIEWEL